MRSGLTRSAAAVLIAACTTGCCLPVAGYCVDTTANLYGFDVRIDPDTLWIVQPGVAAIAKVDIVVAGSAQDTYTLDVDHSIPSHPTPGLTFSLAKTTLQGGQSTTLHVSASPLFVGDRGVAVRATRRVDGAAVLGHITVSTAKPFTLATQTRPTIDQGASSTIPFLVNRDRQFAGDITLRGTAMEPGISISASPASSPVVSGSATLSVGLRVVPGQYDVVLFGSYRSFFDSLVVPVTVVAAPPPVDYVLNLADDSVIVERGSSALTALGIVRSGPSVGAIQASALNPAPGVNITFPVNPISGNSGVVNVDVATAATPGRYGIDILGSWRGITRVVKLTVIVRDPDYKLIAIPDTLVIPRGATKPLVVNINRTSAAIQAVDLTKHNEPSGIVATFPNGMPTHRESGPSANVDVAVAASVPPGTYHFQIHGAALGINRSVNVTVIVVNPPITVSLSPTALTLRAGAAGQTLLSVGGLSYMQSATVQILAPLPAGISATVSPLPTSFSNFVVDVTAAAGTKTGTYQIPVRVVFAGVTYTVTLSLTII